MARPLSQEPTSPTPQEQDRQAREEIYHRLVVIARQAPPRQSIDDQRYWSWKATLDVVLRDLDALG